jgi:hypothetical protein
MSSTCFSSVSWVPAFLPRMRTCSRLVHHAGSHQPRFCRSLHHQLHRVGLCSVSLDRHALGREILLACLSDDNEHVRSSCHRMRLAARAAKGGLTRWRACRKSTLCTVAWASTQHPPLVRTERDLKTAL